jgi:hypothetical protein
MRDVGHGVLDVAGAVPIPPVQMAANGINAIWYAAEGNWGEAGASALGVIPGAGTARGIAKGAEYAGKAFSWIKDGIKGFTAARKEAKLTGDAAEAAKAAEAVPVPAPAATGPPPAGPAPPAGSAPPAGASPPPAGPASPQVAGQPGQKPLTARGQDLINNGTQWTATGRAGGKLPKTAEPDGSVYRKDPNGNISGYAEYNKDGCMSMRYCTKPDAHGLSGQDHVHTYADNADKATGKVYRGETGDPRLPAPEERPHS